MRAWAIGLLLLLAGCSKPVPPAGFSQASKQTIQSFMFDSGIPADAVILPDEDYALPSRAWVERFAHDLLAEQLRRGLNRYEQPANNCNKFSRFAACYAAECWLKDPNRIPGKAIAIGSFLEFNGQAGHAINAALVRDGEQLKMVFLEPQTGGLSAPTRDQIRTGLFVF